MLDLGWAVVVLDNLMTSRAEKLDEFRGHPGFEFIKQDVSNEVAVDGVVTHVLHLASPASPLDFPDYPIQIVKVGTVGTYHMLGLALAKNARFLLASTSEVYGDPLVHPQPESYWGNVNPIGPRGCYDESKRGAEAFAMAYHRARGVDTRIVRIFNTYGPGMRADDGRVVPNFIGQALRGEPLTVYGDGSQTRSLCYIDDLVEGLLAVLEGGDDLPINLGNPVETTMLELAALVVRLTGSRSQVEFQPLPTDDPKRRCPDISRARELLGWEPKVTLEAGLARTVDYFRAALAR
ncbi:MAG: SDR family oxidoreductase [Chloroflexi bacterium]|nr:MAG: SDR family oxidoreductase [Chloroflexota bacterium]